MPCQLVQKQASDVQKQANSFDQDFKCSCEICILRLTTGCFHWI